MPPTVLEPIGASLVVVLVNKYIINKHHLWEYVRRTTEVPEAKQPQENYSSTTTSINGAEVHVHHTY